MSQPAKKLELFAQLLHLHKVYGQRLVVMSRTLRDIGDPGAQRLAECLRAAASHNERWERFLSNDANYIRLADEMWDVEHAQQVYEPLIALMLSEPAPHCVFKAGLEVHQIVKDHNTVVYADDYRNYFHMGMFPVFIIDHFFYVSKILRAYDQIEQTMMLKDIRQFILWLDEQLGSLPKSLPTQKRKNSRDEVKVSEKRNRRKNNHEAQ